jgi:HAD superfamily hydrolase (TIGR01509 family)
MEIVKLNNRNKQLLLFDFDGVLVDSEDFYCDFWYKSLLNYNFQFERSDLLGTSNRDFLNKFEMEEQDKQQLMELKLNAERVFFNSQKIYKPLCELLEELKNYYKMGIVSNNKLSNINRLLYNNDCFDIFQLVISEDTGLVAKPSAVGYLKAIDFFKQSKNRTLIIEDSAIGINAAITAGVDYLVFRHDQKEESINNLLCLV